MDASEALLESRLVQTQQQINDMEEQERINEVRLKVCKDRLKQKPRETDDELQAAYEEMERRHQSTPLTNAEDERRFMRERATIMQKRRALSEYQLVQAELDDRQLKRTNLKKEIAGKKKCLGELQAGLKKLRLSSRIGCNTDDLIEHIFTVPAEKIGRVVGKGGSNIKKIEAECGVSIKTGGAGDVNLKIMGTAKSIDHAISFITNVINTDNEEFSPPDETLVCLLLDKAALTNEIQATYQVRIDVSRAKRLCKIVGLSDNVLMAKNAISALQSCRVDVPIEASMINFIIGKGGSTIKALSGDGTKVQIDISREENLIIVLGFRPEVLKTAEMLKDIIRENREIQETIQTDKHTMIGAILNAGGQAGQGIRFLSKELGVFIQFEKGERGEAHTPSTSNNEPPYSNKNNGGSFPSSLSVMETLLIKGPTSKVIAAKQYLMDLISNYHANVQSIDVPQEMLSLIVGKKGLRIKALREEFPDANIDINGNSVILRCESDDTVRAIKAAIESIILNNYSTVYPIEVDTAIVFKSSKGAEIRAALNEIKVTVDIEANNEAMKIRGLQGNVARAIELLNEFCNNYYCEYLSCGDDDCATLQNGGSNSYAKKVEADMGVEVHIVRSKERDGGSVKIRGPQTAVESAKNAILGYLGGDASQGSLLLPVDPLAFSSLIGKNGANIKKLGTDYKVRIDVLRAKQKLRLRGTPEDILIAKTGITNFIFDVRISSTLDHDLLSSHLGSGNSSISSIKDLAKDTESLFDVEILIKENDGDEKNLNTSIPIPTVTIKGLLQAVDEAKKFMLEKITGTATHMIKLHPSALSYLASTHFDINGVLIANGVTDNQFSSIAEQHSVKIELEMLTHSSLSIRGSANTIHQARLDVYRLLNNIFPLEFSSVAMSMLCLKNIGTYKTLATLSDATGALLEADKLCSCVRVSGPVTAVAAAISDLKEKIATWESLHAAIDVEEYMLPALVGKNGSVINILETENKVKINVNRRSLALEIEASDSSVLAPAVLALTSRVEQLRKEIWQYSIDSEVLIGLLIGKQGSNIKKIRSETGANVDIDPKSGLVKVSGPEDKVLLAKEKILNFLKSEEASNQSRELPIPSGAISFVIGSKGTVAKFLQESSGARIDIDRTRNIAVIRGTEMAVDKCVELVKEILEREGYGLSLPVTTSSRNDSSATADIDVNVDALVHGGTGGQFKHSVQLPPGASPELIASILIREKGANISKSANRRRRRKERKQSEDDGVYDDNDVAKDNKNEENVNAIVKDASSSQLGDYAPSSLLPSNPLSLHTHTPHILSDPHNGPERQMASLLEANPPTSLLGNPFYDNFVATSTPSSSSSSFSSTLSSPSLSASRSVGVIGDRTSKPVSFDAPPPQKIPTQISAPVTVSVPITPPPPGLSPLPAHQPSVDSLPSAPASLLASTRTHHQLSSTLSSSSDATGSAAPIGYLKSKSGFKVRL